MLLRIAILLTIAFSLHAKCRAGVDCFSGDSALPAPPDFTPKWMSPYRMAQFAMVGAAAADIASSWGCAEANPILRSSDGRFRAQGLAIKAGFTAGSLVATHLLKKKFPKFERPLTFMMGGTSTFLYATAFRNHSQPCY
jgi:hypothetical protein